MRGTINHECTKTRRLITEPLHWLSCYITLKIRKATLSDPVIISLYHVVHIHTGKGFYLKYLDVAFHVMLTLNILFM